MVRSSPSERKRWIKGPFSVSTVSSLAAEASDCRVFLYMRKLFYVLFSPSTADVSPFSLFLLSLPLLISAGLAGGSSRSCNTRIRSRKQKKSLAGARGSRFAACDSTPALPEAVG